MMLGDESRSPCRHLPLDEPNLGSLESIMPVARLSASSEPLGLARADATLPDKLRIPAFLLSQSGRILPVDHGARTPAVFLPGVDGPARLIISATPGSGARNVYDVEDGSLRPAGSSQLLGDRPYEIAVELEDGTRYRATVDVSSRTIGVSHQGYETVSDLHLDREPRPLPDSITLAPFFLSQSGNALPRDARIPVVPNNEAR